MAEKARYWTAVLYPENMIKDWESRCEDILEFPFAYCVHDLDHDSKSEQRKDHVHFLLCWNNSTTAKSALELFRKLSQPGRNCCPTVQAVHDVRRMYDYLIHDLDSCRKAGKELYPASARILGNGFDIGLFEQLSTEEKGEAAKELCRYCIESKITSLSDLFMIVTESEDFKDAVYWEAFKLYNAMLERICRAIYIKYNNKNKKES